MSLPPAGHDAAAVADEAAEATPATTAPTRRRSWGDLLPRAASALVMMAAAIGVTLAGGTAFALFWLAAGLLILWEWQGMVAPGVRRRRFALGGLCMAAAAGLCADGLILPAAGAIAAGATLTALIAPQGRRLAAGLGPLYAGLLVCSVILLRRSVPDGIAIVLWLFAVVWGTDTMAYFGGRAIGGPRLAPRLSPSKTWAGFLVGITSGALLGTLVAPFPGCLPCYIGAGLAAGAVAQGGDLFESALKRRFGVKDASHLIPGHGGVMDRLDGFIAASAFALAVGLFRFGVDAAGAGLLQW